MAVPAYLVLTWALFPLTAEELDAPLADEIEPLVYRIREISQAPWEALPTLLTAPFFNHSVDQLIYASAMLLLFGLAVEAMLGAQRTILLFFGTTIAAGLVAGVLLHLIYPEISDRGMFENAWGRSYSGGSAGALGLNGVFAARMRWPFLVLAAFVAWELGLSAFYLRNYTPFFHLTALFTGFGLAMLVLPWVGRREVRPASA